MGTGEKVQRGREDRADEQAEGREERTERSQLVRVEDQLNTEPQWRQPCIKINSFI